MKLRVLSLVATLTLPFLTLPVVPSAEAATWRLFLNGSFASTFEASPAGGPVTGLSVALQSTTYDVPDPIDPPFYRPEFNDFSPQSGGTFANYYNSAASADCAPGECVLFFERTNFGLPGEFIFGAFNMTTFENLGGGDYAIAPIPLPPAGLLLLGAVAGLVVLRRRRA